MSITVKIISILVSIVYCTIYLIIMNKKYPKLKSISKGADYLTKKRNVIAFCIFILMVAAPFWIVLYDAWSWWISVALMTIMVYTGYNQNIQNKQLQNTLHVIFTTGSIIAAMILFVVKAYIYNQFIGLIIILPVLIFGIYTIYALIKKISRRTLKIEVVGIVTGWICEIIIVYLLFEKF